MFPLRRPSILQNFFSAVSYANSRSIQHVSALFNKAFACFEEVKCVRDQENTLLIDVREPSELKETGVIPASINIPLDEVECVLKNLAPEEFQKRFNKPKPSTSTTIIFSCMRGKRSAAAQEIASKLGFKNVKNFSGGWVEWAERNKCS